VDQELLENLRWSVGLSGSNLTSWLKPEAVLLPGACIMSRLFVRPSAAIAVAK
jgi:hypothetical protein